MKGKNALNDPFQPCSEKSVDAVCEKWHGEAMPNMYNILWLFFMTNNVLKHRLENCDHTVNARKLGFIHSFIVFVEIVNFECMRCQHCFNGTIITKAEGQKGTTNEMKDSQK